MMISNPIVSLIKYSLNEKLIKLCNITKRDTYGNFNTTYISLFLFFNNFIYLFIFTKECAFYRSIKKNKFIKFYIFF